MIDGHTCILDVLDTAGQVLGEKEEEEEEEEGMHVVAVPPSALSSSLQDEFTAMREQYMRGGEGFILVYSVTEKSTFQALRQFKGMVDRVRNYETVPMILVGNKSDLEARRKVQTKEGEALAKEFGCVFFETSAALRYNVDEVYHEIVRCIRRKELADHGGNKKTSHKPSGQSRAPSVLCCLGSPTDS